MAEVIDFLNDNEIDIAYKAQLMTKQLPLRKTDGHFLSIIWKNSLIFQCVFKIMKHQRFQFQP